MVLKIFAELALPADAEADADAARFCLHPALLDGCLHVGALDEDLMETRLPFSWSGVTIHAVGATALRVRLAPSAPNGMSIDAADPAGNPVISVRAMVARPVPTGQFEAVAQRRDISPLRLDWVPEHRGLARGRPPR